MAVESDIAPTGNNESGIHEDLRHKADIIARTSGDNLDFKVIFGPKGSGSNWDPNKREYVFDSRILDYPLDEALGVIQHEANHEIVSSLDYVMDLWPELGFAFGMNAAEDPRANHGGMEIMPGTRPWIRAYIERDLSPGGGLDYKGIKADAEERLGYIPKFMQAGAELIRYWHDREFTDRFSDPDSFDANWQQFLEEIPDADVAAFIDKTRSDFEKYYQTVPSSRDKTDHDGKAKESSDIFRNDIWPEYKKLVEQSLKDQAMSSMVSDMTSDQPMIIPFDELPPDVQEEIKEAIRQAAEKKSQQKKTGQQSQKEAEETEESDSVEDQPGDAGEQNGEGQDDNQTGQGKASGEDSGESSSQDQGQVGQTSGQTAEESDDSQTGQGEAPGEEGGQTSSSQGKDQDSDDDEAGEQGSANQIPWDKLSDKAKQAIEQIYDDPKKISEDQKKALEDKAKKDLEDAEDAANEKLEGEIGKNEEAKSHQERREDDSQQTGQEQPNTEEQSEEDRAIAEERWRQAQKEVDSMPKTEQIIRPSGDPYTKTRFLPEVVSTIERWKRDLKPLFEPSANPEKRYRTSGQRPDIRKVIKHEADSRFDKIFEVTGRPLSNDTRISILVDLSGSMTGRIEETFKVLVALAEVASHFRIEVEILGFTDTFSGNVRVYKPFEELKLTDAVRNKIGALVTDCQQQAGGTPTLEATASAYKRIQKRNQRKPMDHNYLITLTDGQPTSSSASTLKKSISSIARDREVLPIGLGIGSGTEFVNDAYPPLPIPVQTELSRKSGKPVDSIGTSFGDINEFKDAFIIIAKSMVQHPNWFVNI